MIVWGVQEFDWPAFWRIILVGCCILIYFNLYYRWLGGVLAKQMLGGDQVEVTICGAHKNLTSWLPKRQNRSGVRFCLYTIHMSKTIRSEYALLSQLNLTVMSIVRIRGWVETNTHWTVELHVCATATDAQLSNKSGLRIKNY